MKSLPCSPRWGGLAVLLLTLAGLRAPAQHLHVETLYSPGTGWELAWYEFETGLFPAGSYTQAVIAAARQPIPNDPVLTNLLGAAGGPVWVLPQNETAELPALGFGTQGAGTFVGGQVQLRLASFNGPGDFLLFTLDEFGGVTPLVATRDGLAASDQVAVPFPGGHVHANWAFTRPGLYELGWQAHGVLAGGSATNSAVTPFRFAVAAITPPQILPALTNGLRRLTVNSEGRLPLRIEGADDLHAWTALTNFWCQPGQWSWTNPPVRSFYRAVHPIP